MKSEIEIHYIGCHSKGDRSWWQKCEDGTDTFYSQEIPQMFSMLPISFR